MAAVAVGGAGMRVFNYRVSHARLLEMLSYDSVTGGFVWRRTVAGQKAGKVAGYTRTDGYRMITIDASGYLAHRLAWLYVNGKWPLQLIDHIDGNRQNNSIGNLREANARQNGQNSNCMGYSIHHRVTEKRYASRIIVDGKALHLGYFSSAQEARSTYLAASEKYFGEFSIMHRGRSV